MNGLVCGEKESLSRRPATVILSVLADSKQQAGQAASSSEWWLNSPSSQLTLWLSADALNVSDRARPC